MKILITGGLCFIGSNFYNHISEKYPDYELVILDCETYAANVKNIDDSRNARVIKFDIQDRDRLFKLFEVYGFKTVIHFAAESHVDNSILNPLKFVQTNIIGTINLLDASVKYGINLFYHISTDEVFGHLGPTGSFDENTPYDPRSPYSASKASSDHFVRAYHHTYGLPVIISIFLVSSIVTVTCGLLNNTIIAINIEMKTNPIVTSFQYLVRNFIIILLFCFVNDYLAVIF